MGMTEEITLIRVDPAFNEIKRYEVWFGNEPKGFVFQWLSQLNLAHETSRIRIDGKKRPFWSIADNKGNPNYRVKLETRKEAVKWLI